MEQILYVDFLHLLLKDSEQLSVFRRRSQPKLPFLNEIVFSEYFKLHAIGANGHYNVQICLKPSCRQMSTQQINTIRSIKGTIWIECRSVYNKMVYNYSNIIIR